MFTYNSSEDENSYKEIAGNKQVFDILKKKKKLSITVLQEEKEIKLTFEGKMVIVKYKSTFYISQVYFVQIDRSIANLIFFFKKGLFSFIRAQ